MKLIENEWQQYIAALFPEKLDENSTQYKEMKKTFYAGYVSLYNSLKYIYNNNDNVDELCNFLAKISKELFLFIENFKMEHGNEDI